MLEVHYYDPFNFTINTANDTIWQWGGIATSAGNTETWANESYVDAQFILIGEYAAAHG